MTDQLVSQRLAVPGGELYYEVRGSGPLLLVVGQPMTSAPFAPVADLLAADHTVVTYDPHGVGQSTVDDPTLPVTPEIEGDDLALIIEKVGGGPADVFGTSGGAVAGLALAAHHPETVRTLIAHEPPVTELVADAPHVRAVIDDMEDAYREGGPGCGAGKFISLVMYSGPVPEDGVPPATWPPPGAEDAGDEQASESDGGAGAAPEPPSEKQQADDELFFLRMLKPFTRYEPKVGSAALRRSTGGHRHRRGLPVKSSPAARPSRWPSGSARPRWSSPATTAGSWPIRLPSPPRSARCWPDPAHDQRTPRRQPVLRIAYLSIAIRRRLADSG